MPSHPTSLRRSEPVSFTRVALRDRFWTPRVETNRRVTLPIEYHQCKDTGRIDAWTWSKGQPHEPHIFWDSDVAKWIEAAAYSLQTHPDAELEARIDGVVAAMAAAQAPDGYLNSHFLRVEPEKRWTNLRDAHELYCAGHLMEAAVAYHAATGKIAFLDVMCRYADCIGRVFGRKRGQKRGYCGHPEIELALVRLFRATGERRYLELATYFIDERGRRPHYFDHEAKARGEAPGSSRFGSYSYYQADRPLREQTEVAGHAVRAMYVYAGMADIAAETGDETLTAALRRLWDSLVLRRLHVTGGIGATCRGEAFTFDYDLPNESAYDETCASIGLVFWAHRMLHLEGDGHYADVLEQALYNGVVSGVSLSGDRFFYANPLAAHPGVDPHGADHGADFHYRRSPWFGCACCPPNIARLLASFGGYVCSEGRDEARVNLYVAGEGRLNLRGETVVLRQTTRYPWDGRVAIDVVPETPMEFVLALRVPGWCRGARLTVCGKPTRLEPRRGYVRIRRTWKAGDRVALTLPMPVERVEANPRVRQDAGRIALRRGPVVYCFEEVDNGAGLQDVVIPRTSVLTPAWRPRLLGGVVVLQGRARRRETAGWEGQLYRTQASRLRSVQIRAVPYAVWGNREPGEMAVWLLDGR